MSSLGPDVHVSLEPAECRQRLADARTGRVALTYKALPIIVRARYVPDGDDIVLQLEDDVLERGAQEGQIVCLETGSDAGSPTWSVAVIGRLSMIPDPASVTVPEAWNGGPLARLTPQITRGTREEPRA